MPRKRYKPEEIVTKLRQVDVLVSQGSSVADAKLDTSKASMHGYAMSGSMVRSSTRLRRRRS